MIGEFFIIKKQFEKHIRSVFTSSKDKILDIGCGKKPHYHRFIKGKIVCFDIKKSDITHIIGNADFLPFKKDSFDKVITVNALYYFKNPSGIIKDISKILKKNGRFVIITPFLYPVHDIPDDKYRFTEYGIRELLKEDFNIKYIKTVGGIFNLPAVVFHSLIKGVPLTAPKSIRKFAGFFSIIIFYPFYIAAQLIGLLDFLDKSRRWPTYYFTVAIKK